MAKSYTDVLADKYYRQITGRARTPLGSRPAVQIPTVAEPAQRNYLDLVGRASDNAVNTGNAHQSWLEKLTSPTSGVGKVLDILTQPLYAVTQTAKETAADTRNPNKSLLEKALSVATMSPKVFTNFAGANDKKMPSDILRGDKDFVNSLYKEADLPDRVSKDVGPLAANKHDNWLQKAGKFTGGLAADIAADPTTYIPFGDVATVGAKVAKAGVNAAEKAAPETIGALKSSKIAQDASEFAKKLPTSKKNRAPITDDLLRSAEKVTEDITPTAATVNPLQIEGPKTHRFGNTSSPNPDGVFRMPAGGTTAVLDEPDLIQMLRHKKTGEVIPHSEEKASEWLTESAWPEGAPKIKMPAFHTPTKKAAAVKDISQELVENTPAAVAKVAPVAQEVVEKAASPKFEAWLKSDKAKTTHIPEIDPDSGKVLGRRPAAQLAKIAAEPKTARVELIKALSKGEGKAPAVSVADVKEFQRSAKASLDAAKTQFEKQFATPQIDPAALVAEVRAAATPGSTGLEAARQGRQAVQAAQQEAKSATRASRSQAKVEARRAARRGLKMQGASKRSWVQARLNEGFDFVDAAKLASSKSKAEFNRTYKQITGKTVPTEKAYEPLWLPVLRAEKTPEPVIAQDALTGETIAQNIPTNPFDEAKVGLDTAAEQVARAPKEISPEAEAALAQKANVDELPDSVRGALRDAMGDQQFDKKFPGGDFPYETKRGVRRNKKTAGEGFGRHREANRHFQANLLDNLLTDPQNNAIIREIRQNARTAAATGDRNAWAKSSQQIQDFITPQLRQAEDFLVTNKMYPHAGLSEGVPITLSQTFDALSASKAGRDVVTHRIFDLVGRGMTKGTSGPGLVDTDALLKIVEDVVRHVTAESGDFEGFLKKNLMDNWTAQSLRSGTLSARAVESALAHEVTDAAGNTTRRGIANLTAKDAEGKTSRRLVSPEQASKISKQVADAFTDTRVLHKLFQAVHDNSAVAGIQFGRTVKNISEDAITASVERLDDTTGVFNNADKMDAILHPEKMIDESPKAKEPTTSPEEKKAAKQVTQEHMAEEVSTTDEMAAKLAERLRLRSDQPLGKRVRARKDVEDGIEKHEQVLKHALEDVEITPEILNDFDNIDYSFQTNTFRILDFLANHFTAGYGNGTIHSAMVINNSVGGVAREAMQRELTQANNTATKIAQQLGIAPQKLWADTFKKIQQGAQVNQFDRGVQEFAGQVRHAMDYFFATPRPEGEAQGILSLFQREGFDYEHINHAMSNPRYALPEDFRIQTQVKGEKGMRDATPAEMSEQWRSWKIDDPLGFMARMERVSNDLATQTAISREAWRLGQKHGLMSTKPRPGFVRASRDTANSTVLKYLPTNEQGHLYIHKDVLPEIKRMDDLMRGPSGKGFDRFARNNLDPIISMWKYGMTVARPGHHVRTLVGDTSMSYLMSGVKDPRYYLRSIKMATSKQGELGRGFRGSYGGWDAMKALQGLSRSDNPALLKELEEIGGVAGPMTKPVAVVNKGRKGQSGVGVTQEQLSKMMMDRGALPNFRQQEDIVDGLNNAEAITKKIGKKTGYSGSPAQQIARKTSQKLGEVTEGRDDFVRQAHAMHLIENGINGRAWKSTDSLDDIMDQVAAQIRKVHPDGTDLTPTEKNGMRRIFPFYSWYRKAVPLIVEATLSHPGRVTAYPKGMYNFAQANGVDLNSLTEPFPEDQVFPNFLRDKMTGVIGKVGGDYWTGDAGYASADVLNMLAPTGTGESKGQALGNTLSGPLKGIAGMLNPAIKAPLELGMGKSVQGIPITDKSDYIDQSIPGLNSINSILGISPTGSVASGLQGQGLDKTRAAEKGNRGGVMDDPQYLVNYLLGTQLYNTSKPNIIRKGNIDLRNKIGQGN